jgi:hypothetical protein
VTADAKPALHDVGTAAWLEGGCTIRGGRWAAPWLTQSLPFLTRARRVQTGAGRAMLDAMPALPYTGALLGLPVN